MFAPRLISIAFGLLYASLRKSVPACPWARGSRASAQAAMGTLVQGWGEVPQRAPGNPPPPARPRGLLCLSLEPGEPTVSARCKLVI